MPSKAAPIRTPLRYPGGKQKALAQIFAQFPAQFSSYREPFVGGGSVFIAVRQAFPDAPVWINDLNPEVYSFWITARDQLPELVKELRQIKDTATDGKKLYLEWRALSGGTVFDRAVRFFVMNRVTFSGTTDSGGYSSSAFQSRFTHSSLDRLELLGGVMGGVRVTNLDYREVVKPLGSSVQEPSSSSVQEPSNSSVQEPSNSSVFVFLDPPYWSATKSKLYGANGNLHAGFDHAAFAATLEACPHQWLVTYDDSPLIREYFEFAQVSAWELQYGMNNYRQATAAKGAELFIRNAAE